MDRVRKILFNPLATTKAQIKDILKDLPVGSAHPCSPERILLCRTDNGIEEIDISSYPDDYFFNAVDLGEMGEVLLRRMSGFQKHLAVFSDFQIVQAPSSTFKVPLVRDQITMLAVSERKPTYYDFCFADAERRACCYCAKDTFKGISHSGDHLNGQDFLAYVRVNDAMETDKEICVFISGFQRTKITRFLGTHPAVLVADHAEKLLYIVPVPLDAATIGDATICCPMVIKRDDTDPDSLICSILPKATTDTGKMCDGRTFVSNCIPEAIRSADFTISKAAKAIASKRASDQISDVDRRGADMSDKEEHKTESTPSSNGHQGSEKLTRVLARKTALITTKNVSLPRVLANLNSATTQKIRFGTSIDFGTDQEFLDDAQSKKVILPCLLGSQLEGPILLATGRLPSHVPFYTEKALQQYYKTRDNIVVVVDDRMTDNARNLASPLRLNALYIVLPKDQTQPKDYNDVVERLNALNINAVTATAGPQSLVVAQIKDRLYFYRGLASRDILNTSRLAFGADITEQVESAGTRSIIDLRAKRIIHLDTPNEILLPVSGRWVRPQDLELLFERLSAEEVNALEEDVVAAVPQLQILMSQKDLQDLSKSLVAALSAKVSTSTGGQRSEYLDYIRTEYKIGNADSERTKGRLLGDLRKKTNTMQKQLEPVISSLANMISAQTTSKRTHDLKRLVRQAAIQTNVDSAKEMSFEAMALLLEEHASEMGVMLVNIGDLPYRQVLANIRNATIDAGPACELDSRMVHLCGLDAGLILEQSQAEHNGPLRSQSGPTAPSLAMPHLSNTSKGAGSMLAWVCWDEFVNLEDPYSVRWVDKCNEAHISALRIIMRSTLATAVASREHNMQSNSPETGILMAAMLMASMRKLAGLKSAIPGVIATADDTVTKLMRGLFANLLTIAGSGLRPMSMVWQLFGLFPQWEIPKTDADWVWYETVVALYPYTGWKREQFYNNLEKLLDKVVIRVVTKGEDVGVLKTNTLEQLVKYCRLRNIQLEHSRTIITALFKMFSNPHANVQGITARLLEHLPDKLEKQSGGYARLINYLRHLVQGGQRRVADDAIVASVYTKRSAAFAQIKTMIGDACRSSDWEKVKSLSQALLEQHAKIAGELNIPPGSFNIQNMKAYKDLEAADFSEIADEAKKLPLHELMRRALNDAEKYRVPWQVGKEGQYSDKIEPLDENLLHGILTGESMTTAGDPASEEAVTTLTVVGHQSHQDSFEAYRSALQPYFIDTMQKDLTADDVYRIVKVPVNVMRTFVQALNPAFEWKDLATNFKAVMLELVKNRSDRESRRPTKKLLGGQDSTSRNLLLTE